MTNDNKPEKQAVEQKTQEHLGWLAREHLCARCEQSADVRYGCEFESGDICDTCAQGELQSLRQQLAAAKPAIDFCSGIHIETLTLLNQADHPTLNQICEENQSLGAENKILNEQVEDFQHQRGELIPANILLREENQNLRKHLAEAKKAITRFLNIHDAVIDADNPSEQILEHTDAVSELRANSTNALT